MQNLRFKTKIIEWIKKRELLSLFLLLFFPTFCLYAFTAARLPVNFADSDDLTLAGYYGSLAHPPGYPLQVILLFLWFRLLPFVETAFAANVLAALLQSWVVASFGTLAYLLSKNIITRKFSLWIWLSVLTGSLVYAISPQSWLYGTVFEVFPLSTLFFSLALIVLLRRKGGMFLPAEILGGILFGLTLWAHQLWLPLILIALFFLYRNKPGFGGVNKVFFGLIMGLVIGLGIFWWQGRATLPYGWHLDKSFKGIITFLSRAYYAKGGSQLETYTAAFDLDWSIQSSIKILTFLAEEFGFFLPFFLLSIWILIKERLRGWQLVLLSLLLYGPGLLFYFKLPRWESAIDTEYFWGTFYRTRMLFIFNWLLALMGALGLAWMMVRSSNRLRLINRNHVMLLFALILTVTLVYRFDYLNAADDNFIFEYGKKIISDLPPDSILIVDSDMVFTFLYQQSLNLKRQDITIVPLRIRVTPFKEEKIGQDYLLEFSDPKQFAGHMTAYNLLKNKRVFLYGPEASVLEYLGGEGNPFFISPYGYTLEVKRDNKPADPSYDFGLTKQVSVLRSDRQQLWESGVRGHLAEIHLQLLYYAYRWGWEHIGFIHQQLADELAETPTLKQGVAMTSLHAQEKTHISGTLAQISPLSAEVYLTKAKMAINENKLDETYYFVTRAILLAPLNEEAYQLLLKYYYIVGDQRGVNETVAALEKLASNQES